MRALLALGLLVAGAVYSFDVRPVPDQAFTQAPLSSTVWDAYIGNRRQMSGATFYVRHVEGKPCKVTLRFQSMGLEGQLRDSQPANLVWRVFGPDDRSIVAATISQSDTRLYETTVDLSERPAGRYRFALTGWYQRAEVSVDPPQPIGVIGSRNLGIEGSSARYLLVPPGINTWTAAIDAVEPGQTLTLTNPNGDVMAELEAPDSTYFHVPKWVTAELPGTPGVWRLDINGEARKMLNIEEVPAILWPTAEAAAIPDFELVEGRRVDHAWQRPLLDYLNSLTAKDLALPELPLPKPDFDALPDETIFKLSQLAGWRNGMTISVSLLQHNQITDLDNPAIGLFVEDPSAPGELPLNPDGKNVYDQVFYVYSLAMLLAAPVEGYNPWYQHSVLRTRVAAALCQLLLMVPEDQHIGLHFVQPHLLGKAMWHAYAKLPPELQEPIRAGLLEHFSRDSYFDGYQSNQGLNVILGLKTIAEITGDPVLKAWYERYISAFLADQFVDVNHGQTPAGFYQESGGLDGGYNSFSQMLLIELWHMTDAPRLKASLERNAELLRHLAVTLPNGELISARNWNTRTDSLAFRWHDIRAGASIPLLATFITRFDGLRYSTDRQAIIANLKQSWNHPYPAELDTPKRWSAGGTEAEDGVPFAENPPPLACEEPSPFSRAFGDTYGIIRRGPWQAILYTGDRWCAGRPGSGLATLWHQQLGPLILSDTKRSHAKEEPPAHPFVVADLWDGGSTESWHGTVSLGDDYDATVRLTPLRGEGEFIRYYEVGETIFSTTAETRPGQTMVLPLVRGPQVELKALTADGSPLPVEDLPDSPIAGWRWTGPDGVTATLRYASPMRTTILRDKEPCAPGQLLIIAVEVGPGQEANWTVE